MVTSPAAEALEFLTMEGGAQVQSGSDTIDPQNLLIDLNDLLRYGRNSIPFASVVKKNHRSAWGQIKDALLDRSLLSSVPPSNSLVSVSVP